MSGDTLRFECLRCGRCCQRIRVRSSGLAQGLSLLPGEEKLFAEFPGAVMPYAAIIDSRRRNPRPKPVSYQMVMEPCPLYDPDTNACTQYAHRPAVCRAYPFAHSGAQIEANCGWRDSVRTKLKYGETPVEQGAEQINAEKQVNMFFIRLHQRMQRTGRTTLLLYDVDLLEWVQIEAAED